MSKILKNNTDPLVVVSLADIGFTLQTTPDYTMNTTEYDLFAGSDNLMTAIGNGDIIVNDGSFDLGISDGISLIKGNFPTKIIIQDSSGNEASISNGQLNTNVVVDVTSVSTDHKLEIAKGVVANTTGHTKYGRIPDLDNNQVQDINPFGNVVLMTTAAALDLESSSVKDKSSSTGAFTVMIWGLDSNWDEITEVLNLDGTTIVPTVNAYIRINKMQVITSDTSSGNVGIVTLKNGNDTQAHIEPEKNSTEQIMFSVPNGKTAYVTYMRGSAGNSVAAGIKQCFLEFMVKPFGGPWIQSSSESIGNEGGPSVFNTTIPMPIPAKSDVKIIATSYQVNTQITAIIQYILVGS